MADFIFRVDSVHLTEEQKEKIASAIQGAVLTELAKLDLHGERTKGKATTQAALGPSSGGFLYIPIHWYGGRMIDFAGVETAVNTVLAVEQRPAEQNRAA